MRWLSVIIVAGFAALATTSASAQPFFGGGAVGFAPQISTVNSGAVLTAGPVVSADQKYVTLNVQTANSNLLALRNFQFQSGLTAGGAAQTPQVGFVGGVNPTGAVPVGISSQKPGTAATGSLSTSPEEIDRRAVAARSVLNRRGMFLLTVH